MILYDRCYFEIDFVKNLFLFCFLDRWIEGDSMILVKELSLEGEVGDNV